MKTAAAYIRVSDNRQDEYSPSSQLKLIREHAKKNDVIVPDEYVFYDDGISAKSAKKRTAFNNMIALAKDKEHPFDIIYVWKFSRFARNQEESIVYKSLLKKKGVQVVSVSEPILDGAFGSLIERIIEWMDEYYLIRLSGEVTRGMTEKATRGEPLSIPPFGYDMINKRLVPNKDAQTVKTIFQKYTEGKKEREIAVECGNEGVRTRRGNLPDNRFINYILNNPVYIGKIRWSPKDKAASRRRFDDNSIIVSQGNHEPIIDRQTWETAQKMLKQQKKTYSKYQRNATPANWLLKGKVRCSNCGSTLVLNKQNNSVQCHAYAKGLCKISHSVTLNKLEKAFIIALERYLSTLNFPLAPAPAKPVPEKNYEKLIATEKRKLERCKEAYLNGVDSIKEYKANKEKLERTVAKLEKEKKQEEKARNPKLNKKEFAKKVKSVLNVVKSDAPIEIKNEAINTIISNVTYNKKNEHISILFYI